MQFTVQSHEQLCQQMEQSSAAQGGKRRADEGPPPTGTASEANTSLLQE